MDPSGPWVGSVRSVRIWLGPRVPDTHFQVFFSEFCSTDVCVDLAIDATMCFIHS